MEAAGADFTTSFVGAIPIGVLELVLGWLVTSLDPDNPGFCGEGGMSFTVNQSSDAFLPPLRVPKFEGSTALHSGHSHFPSGST